MDHQVILEHTRRWISSMVIGLNLCPFAERVFQADLIRYVVSDAHDETRLLQDLAKELQTLAVAPIASAETTLLIHPFALGNFLDFNDFLHTAEGQVAAQGLRGVLQIASFHPRYQFAGTAADALENFTNRSPYPMLHLLREASITQVAGDPDKLLEIPHNNMKTLRGLGRQKILDRIQALTTMHAVKSRDMNNAETKTGMDRQSTRQWLTDVILGPDFRAATFGGPVRGTTPCPWVRVAIRPVELRGQKRMQFSYFDAKKHITKNADGRDSALLLDEVLDVNFAAVHLSTSAEEIDIRTTKKGKIVVGRAKAQSKEGVQPHNRIKDVPLPEGQADWLLEAMGILTRDGHVRPAKRAKFTQINEFLKQLRHVLDEAGLRSLGRDVEILDCGCGSSFLTLAVHHYLNDVLGIAARIVGVDVDEELIRKSVERAEKLGTERLEFLCGPIGAVDAAADIVLALHACDTATDDAIARAIRARAKIVLSVPCCHHHLNDQLRSEVLRPLLRHGILHQRAADLITDAFRALVLRIMGYRTEVVEFIGTEHTARNLMIRAVHGVPIGEASFVSEYLEMRRFWGVTPYIEGVLGEPFQQLLAAAGP